MSKTLFVALGVAVLCALPILGTAMSPEDAGHRTARKAVPPGSIGVYEAPTLEQGLL
jgi:hypothetical protein